LSVTVQQSDMKLDGNAIGGLLRQIFAMEMTTAQGTCANCGTVHMVGEVVVYLNAPGVVVRCPSCDYVQMKIVRGRDRYWIDMSGVRCLEFSI
jgi:Zn finger protein HypA/HybF involved in hydrogenase expression